MVHRTSSRTDGAAPAVELACAALPTTRAAIPGDRGRLIKAGLSQLIHKPVRMPDPGCCNYSTEAQRVKMTVAGPDLQLPLWRYKRP
jgi:hypothetical protein